MIVLKLNIKIITLGKIKEKFLRAGIDEFLKRLRPYTSIYEIEINPIEIKDINIKDKILIQEGEKILSHIKSNDYVITKKEFYILFDDMMREGLFKVFKEQL